MITHNVTSAELRAKGIWCVTSEEYESHKAKSVIVKGNSSTLNTKVYEGALMELEVQLAYNGKDKKRYLRAVNKIKQEMNSVTAEGIHFE